MICLSLLDLLIYNVCVYGFNHECVHLVYKIRPHIGRALLNFNCSFEINPYAIIEYTFISVYIYKCVCAYLHNYVDFPNPRDEAI